MWLIVVFILIGGTAYYVFSLKKLKPFSLREGAPAPTVPAPKPAPAVTFYATGKQKVQITWSNLPEGTNLLRIFRAKKGTTDWKLWKTISIENPGGGSEELILSSNEFTIQYSFYAEAGGVPPVSGGAEVTFWSSPESSAIPPPPPPSPPSSPTSSEPQSQNNNPNDQDQQSTSSTPQTQSETGTSTPSSTPPPGGDVYYTPDGQISGVLATTSDLFWVQHINNRNIEINWQNLPLTTDNIIVTRSSGASGPWEQLLVQNNPAAPGHGNIALLDLTINQDQYYRLQARSGESVIQTYGPVLLPALQE